MPNMLMVEEERLRSLLAGLVQMYLDRDDEEFIQTDADRVEEIIQECRKSS